MGERWDTSKAKAKYNFLFAYPITYEAGDILKTRKASKGKK